MANKDDYLTCYREFFENFAQTVNPNDQLPVKLGSYKLINHEVIGGVIDWTTQYLTQKKCPQSLIAPLIQIVIDETRKSCKKQPTACGFNTSDNAYEPLKLMQTVMAKTNEICLRYLDNSMLCSLPAPGVPHYVVSVCAAKNKRRRMEDRHVVVHDLNTMFNIQEASPSSYYAIFDGHAGHDAAAYSAAHLHQFLAESKHFVANPEQALFDAFCKTDSLFIDKCNVERFNSGTTAVCALLRPKEKALYIAWVGDSQALLVNQGRVLQCVNPHKPCRTDERERIEKQGGYVCYWGTWRVNGQLAVSRAIGDAEYKPYVIALPDVREIPLDGGEDFLILACDGLWDFLSEDDAARTVYEMVCNNPDDTDLISERLVNLSKERGSADNISVIVVFLREPSKISAEAHWANRNNTMDTSLDNANNPFANSNGSDNNILPQKSEGLLLNLSENLENFKHNGSDLADLSPTGDYYHNTEKPNGKRLASDFDDDDDLGPETDVDAVDDVLSPSIEQAKAMAEGIVNNNPDGSFNPFLEKQEFQEVEKAALEIDLDLQKQQSSEFDGQRSPREETPTPPADAVHDGGLEENIGDSGEESEDEWNYIKGEEANKENVSPSQPDCEVANILEDQDSMSQLNPNAAEFVPVSPTRSIPSPACRLVLDPVIAQSPKRPSDIDINLPNPQEFENEVKSRPSDFDSFSNGHDHEGDQKPPSSEMENLLNGKNIDEIPEFQPGTTPSKVADEFHFGPNAAPFTPVKLLDQSEAALSTKAVYGDDDEPINLDMSTEEASRDNVDFTKKEEDPMSMSFYQDKDDSDPFGLNKVQLLPENLEDFLSKENEENKENTEPDPAKDLLGDVILLNNDERIQTTDLDRVVDDEKELASPVSNDDDSSGVCDLAKSPVPQSDDLIGELCERPESKASQPELRVESPEVDLLSPEPPVEAVSPVPVSSAEATSPAPVLTPEPTEDVSPAVLSPEPTEDVCQISRSPMPSEDVCQLSKSPEPIAQISKTPEPSAPPSEEVFTIPKSPEPAEQVCQIPKSPEPIEQVCQISKSPEPVEQVCQIPKSPEPLEQPVPVPEPVEQVCQIVRTPEPSQIPKSPEPSENVCQSPEPSEEVCQIPKSPEPSDDVCQITKSPEPIVDICEIKKSPEPTEDVSPVTKVETPEPEIVAEERRDLSVESPLEDITSSVKDVSSPIASPLPELAEPKIDLSFAQEINNAVESTLPVEQSSPLRDETLIPDVCPLSTPKSSADTESVATTDLNSFLERSNMANLVSPLSINQQEFADLVTTEIKTENIAPEFAEPAVLSPMKDETPSVPSQDETVKEPEVAPVVAAAAAAAGAAAATAAVVAATTEKKKETPKTTKAPAKKPTPRPTAATSPTKPKAPALAKPKPTTARTIAAPKLPITKAPAKPKTPTTTTTRLSTEKKPTMNGDVKTPVRSSLTARKSTEAKPPIKAATTSKPSPTKPAAPRPTTAPTRTAAKPTTTAPKPRPTTLANKTGVSSTLTKTTSSTTTTSRLNASKTATSPKTSSPPKPRPTTAPVKARVPLTKTVTKTATSADTEKQNKDSANKLTASRTLTSTRTSATASARSVTSTVRKTESKTTGTTRTTVTKSSTTTSRPAAGKKPQEITRTATKTKTTKVEKPIQNGVGTVVTEQITIVSNLVNDSDSLVKDNSPIDNKLIVETNAAD